MQARVRKVRRRNNVYPLITRFEWMMLYVVLSERLEAGDWQDPEVREDYEQLLRKISIRGQCAE